MRLARGALDPYTGMVVCDTPSHDTPTACVVEVSFDNGETYTSSGKVYTLYAEPSLASVTPFCRLTAGVALHVLKGPGLEAAGEFTKVRFSAAWQSEAPPVVVAGEWDSEKQGLVCRSLSPSPLASLPPSSSFSPPLPPSLPPSPSLSLHPPPSPSIRPSIPHTLHPAFVSSTYPTP